MLENYRAQIRGVLNDLQIAPSGVVLYTGIDILERANPNDTPTQNIIADVSRVILRLKAVNYRMAYDFLKGVEHLWDYIFRDPTGDVRELIGKLSRASELKYLYSFSGTSRQFLALGSLYRITTLSAASCDFLRTGKLPFNLREEKLVEQKEPAEKSNVGSNHDTEDKKQPDKQERKGPQRVPVKRRNLSGQKTAELKQYRVAVSQTHYGEVVVQARNEAEALEIVKGNRAMHNGDSAAQHFRPMSPDAYLTICEFEDGRSVKECG